MHDTPLLSICCVTYQHAPYIRQAVESMLAQETSFPFEICIGEDESSDGTREICQELASKDRRIRLFLRSRSDPKRKGCLRPAEYNWKETLAECRGRYVAELEGDDYWTDPCKLQKQVELLEKHPCYAGSAHQSMVIRDNNEVGLFKINVPDDISMRDIIRGRLFHTSSIVFRRTVLQNLFASPSVFSGDRLLYFCICLEGRFHYMEECMGAYRKHSGGLSTTCTPEELLLDMNCIPYLKKIYPAFPRYSYASYVYATAGLCKNASLYKKIYYTGLSVLLSFSCFPKNIGEIAKYLLRLIGRCSRANRKAQ